MALSRICLLIIGVFGFSASIAQVNRYMVFFKDKHGTPYNIHAPGDFLSHDAIARRIHQGLTVTELDLPVNPAYTEGVKQTGVDVFYSSKWFNAVLVQCEAVQLPAITGLAFVDHVEYVAPGQKLIPSGRRRFNLRHKDVKEDVTQTQLAMLGIHHMHNAEIFGDSMTIAVFDSGFQGVDTIPAFNHLFENEQINATLSHDFVYNTKNVYRYDDHGTEVFSVIAAEIPDAFTGGAPKAKFQLYVTEDGTSEYKVEEYNWVFAAERADSAGVDIITSSLGYYDFDDPSMNYSKSEMDGQTAVSTRAAQWAAERGIVVVVSAGNEGNIAWRLITAPADAEDVIAVANVDSQGNRSPSSSIGPSADNRIKPDLAALGTGVKTIKANGTQGASSGTSLAAPLITSLVAGVWQRYPYLTNFEVIELLKRSATLAQTPNNLLGYGIPNFEAVVAYHDEIEHQNLFEVYPNPVVDTLTLSPIDPDSVSNCFIELISSHGQIIAQENVNFDWLNRKFHTDVSALAAGIYFVRVWYDNKRYVFKIVRV